MPIVFVFTYRLNYSGTFVYNVLLVATLGVLVALRARYLRDSARVSTFVPYVVVGTK